MPRIQAGTQPRNAVSKAVELPIQPGMTLTHCFKRHFLGARSFAGFGQFLTPVPDYATALSIDLPLAVTANCGIAWVDVFGTRFPASAAAFAQAPICVGRNEFTVPWWASAFHVFQNGAAITSPVQCTWQLTL